MSSGIYAISNFGNIQLYVGEVQHMKTRWPKMMAQLEQGTFPDKDIQRAWESCGGDRRFTFHTAEQIKSTPQLRGRKLFLKDLQKA
jgi:hypothetical protein